MAAAEGEQFDRRLTTLEGQQLDQRLSALEDQQYSLRSKVKRATQTAVRAANGLDDLERMYDELSESTAVSGGPVVLDGMLFAQGLDVDPGQSPSAATPPPTPAKPAAPPVIELTTLHAWVARHIAPMQRKLTTTGEGGGIRWCRRWWAHFDAVTRFEALYLIHGALAEEGQPGWQSVFLRDHVDQHLAILTSPFGPFAACHKDHHSDVVDALGQNKLDTAAPTQRTTNSGGTP
jgi:Domain of unknown function (DUF4913)